jgi:uncharacterized protein
MSDFRYDILREGAHRPWPMPRLPWIMTQTWHDLLFAHWPVGASALLSKIPRGLALDLFDGQAWVGIVPFQMTNVAPRATPALPWLSAFAEMNVRTYVRVGSKPGVYFFSLDAANPIAVAAARLLFHLPYFTAAMTVGVRGDEVTYASRRRSRDPPAQFTATYRPTGPVRNPERGSLEYFLTERYCLYTVDRKDRVMRGDIHHPPWPIQSAVGDIRENTMADAAGIHLPQSAPLLHFAKRQDVVVWPLRGAASEPAARTAS